MKIKQNINNDHEITQIPERFIVCYAYLDKKLKFGPPKFALVHKDNVYYMDEGWDSLSDVKWRNPHPGESFEVRF